MRGPGRNHWGVSVGWVAAGLAAWCGGPALASEFRVPTVSVLLVRTAPDPAAPVRGRLVAGEPFEVVGPAEGPGCAAWGAVAAGGFACLDHAEPSAAEPVALPRLLPYDPPYPEDFDAYLETGAWPERPPEALLPFVYARRWKAWKGRTWPGAEHWAHGDAPTGQLPAGRRARFVGVVETERGTALLRADGTAVPEEEVYVFPVTRLRGRDLVEAPVPEGLTVGWAVGWEGASVWAEPGVGEPIATVGYHQEVLIRAGPTGWWEAPAVPGWVRTTEVHGWVPGDRPDGVADDTLWVDVDLSETTLALVRGDVAEFVTLISPGTGGRYATPTGQWRMTDKSAYWDMASAPGAADVYHVEAVPWVMHFKPRYAVHGAYWHWGFGHGVSHGCVNLAPRDAAVVFDRIGPALPAGWHTVYATADDPGTLIRIRR